MPLYHDYFSSKILLHLYEGMDLQLLQTTTIMSFIVVDLPGSGGTTGESVAFVETLGIQNR